MVGELDQLNHHGGEMMRTIGHEVVDFALALPSSRPPRSKNMSTVGGQEFDQLTIACFFIEITSEQIRLSMMIRI